MKKFIPYCCLMVIWFPIYAKKVQVCSPSPGMEKYTSIEKIQIFYGDKTYDLPYRGFSQEVTLKVQEAEKCFTEDTELIQTNVYDRISRVMGWRILGEIFFGGKYLLSYKARTVSQEPIPNDPAYYQYSLEIQEGPDQGTVPFKCAFEDL